MGNSLQFSTMGNSHQQKLNVSASVSYQHGTLQTDISNLQTSEVETLEINWSDTPSQEKYVRCTVEILRLLESHKFPKVNRLVLNNLFYFSGFVENLVGKFPNIEYLKILPFNSRNDEFYTDFSSLTTLRELEIRLRFSDGIVLCPPIQLKELSLMIFKVASERIGSYVGQWIHFTRCTSLESL